MSKNLNELLESIPISIYESDFTLERTIKISNEYTLDFLDIENSEGIRLIDFMSKDSIKELETELKVLERLKKPVQLTYKITTKSGKEKWVQDKIIPILDEEKNILSLQGIITDVTIQRKAELIMFDYNEALKKGIDEKTFQLTILNRELSETNQMKDKFFSIISHDLRGPFSGLMKYVELLLESSNDITKKELLEGLTDIHESSKNLYELMENLLTWSQVQTNSIKLNKKELSVKDMIEEVISSVSINAKIKGIKLSSHVSKEFRINVDKFTLKTAIYNLVTNAIKFTPKDGSVVINSNTLGKSTFIEVKDTGVGIPQKVQDNIFNIKTKTTSKGTEGEMGTGLGLILTKEFVELNDGALNILSEVSKGTTITIAFPNKSKDEAA